MEKQMKSALESMMYVWGEPLNVKSAAEILEAPWQDVYTCLKKLQEEYETERRGIRIREVNKCFQFVTAEENAPFIRKLCTPVKQKRLSQSALEVLAIIAYKQPVTKSDIEAIRGIKCDRVMDGLQKKDLVRGVGRSDGVGRPLLYGTTDRFLKNFGFESLEELPEIEEIGSVIGEEDLPEGAELQQIASDLPE